MNSENMEFSPGKIYAAIAGVIADVGYVAKDKVNKQQGFKYRSVDDVFNALHPALASNKVFIVPQILERDCGAIGKTKNGVDMIKVVCKIKFTFYTEDGSFVEAVIVGEGLDTGDKATNKAMAVAYKYACFQVFCIPTEEMTDPDAECSELGTDSKQPVPDKGKTGAKKGTANKKDSAPINTDDSAPNEEAKATEDMINKIKAEQARTGVSDEQILGRKAIKAKSITGLTVKEFNYVMDVFAKTPDLVGGARNE